MKFSLPVRFISLVSGPLLFLLLSTTFVSASSMPVLLYHYIGPVPNLNDKARKELSVSPENFDRQMAYLAQNGFEPVTLGYMPYVFDGSLSPSGKKPVLLTFDDGYMDFYFNAFPILKKYNFHAVSFIPTGLMNKNYYMTWDQIKEIQGSGLVEFEGHSVSHANLAQISSARLEYELTESKKTLEAFTGKPVHYLAYPFGASSVRVAAAARALGYVGAFSEQQKRASALTLSLPRLKIGGRVTLTDFQNRLK